MSTAIKFSDKTMTISISGRLDTTEAANADATINDALAKTTAVDSIILDAEELTFISSTGLRIIISLKKRCNHLEIINVSSEVYNIFEMTGFTKILSIRKALRRISIEGCPEIGRGGIGVVYKISDDTIVKVFRQGSPLSELEKEISMAKEAFILGMPTAISYDIVRVDDQYGLIYEMLNAETLATAIRNNPDRLEEYAVQFAHMTRSMHDIEIAPGGIIPNAHANDEAALSKLTNYFSQEDVELLRQIHHDIPQGNRLLHCDLHPKNVMLQGNELLFIDMGEVGYGNPLLDLAHTYSAMGALVGDYEQIIGMTEEQSHRFFDRFIREYFADLDEAAFQQQMDMIRHASLVRNFSWLSLSDNFPQEVVDNCKREFDRRVKRV